MKENRKGLLGALFDGDSLRKRSICHVYYGSTAGSTLANPPCLMASVLGGKVVTMGSTIIGTGKGSGGGLWFYTSTDSSTEASSGTNSGNYFTDAYALGMRNGDVLMWVGATAATTVVFTIGVVQAITSTGHGAFLSTGSAIGSTR